MAGAPSEGRPSHGTGSSPVSTVLPGKCSRHLPRAGVNLAAGRGRPRAGVGTGSTLPTHSCERPLWVPVQTPEVDSPGRGPRSRELTAQLVRRAS